VRVKPTTTMRAASLAMFLAFAHLSSFFPVSRALVQVAHSFDFPFVPFELGIRHIHTPEHLVHHHATLPGFRLVSTDFPARAGGSSNVIGFRFRTWLGGAEQQARMFTDARDRSSVMVFDADDRALLLANLRVEPLGAQGHRLRVDATVFQEEMGLVPRLLLPLLLNAHALEDTLSWGYTIRREDSNFRCYRRRVLHPARRHGFSGDGKQ